MKIKELAHKSLGRDRFGYRKEFLKLVEIAETLDSIKQVKITTG